MHPHRKRWYVPEAIKNNYMTDFTESNKNLLILNEKAERTAKMINDFFLTRDFTLDHLAAGTNMDVAGAGQQIKWLREFGLVEVIEKPFPKDVFFFKIRLDPEYRKEYLNGRTTEYLIKIQENDFLIEEILKQRPIEKTINDGDKK
jgi:hypothetical protein